MQTVTSPGGGGVGRTISTTVDSLRPHVQYKARVAAENALGKGQPCEQILVSCVGKWVKEAQFLVDLPACAALVRCYCILKP